MMAKPADKNIVSGNSRVKVTIYGQVNRALRYANTGDETEITSVDNDGSGSRLGVRAVGKANPNLTIGSLTEVEWRQNHRSGTSEANSGATPGDAKYEDMRVRHVDLWLDHKDMGKLSMGHGPIAGDASGLLELTGVSFVYGFAGANGTDGTKADASVKTVKGMETAHGASGDQDHSNDTMKTMDVRGKARGFRPFNFFGARENRIRYDTPSLMGLRASASYGENKSWSVGLRYFGNPPGSKDFTVIFGAGYRKNNDEGASATKRIVTGAWAVSGGVKHSSGFNLNGHYDSDAKSEGGNDKHKNSQWGVSGGWAGKINDAGGTAIGIGYNRSSDGMDGKSTQFWGAIVQKVDAAATDVYAGLSYDSGTVTHTVSAAEGLNGAMAGSGTPAGGDLVLPVAEKGSPCFMADSAGTGYDKAAAGSTCEVKRKGVFNFLVGVRVKF